MLSHSPLQAIPRIPDTPHCLEVASLQFGTARKRYAEEEDIRPFPNEPRAECADETRGKVKVAQFPGKSQYAGFKPLFETAKHRDTLTRSRPFSMPRRTPLRRPAWERCRMKPASSLARGPRSPRLPFPAKGLTFRTTEVFATVRNRESVGDHSLASRQ